MEDQAGDSAGGVRPLKADIEKALSEVAAGRLTEFNADQVIERAKKLLAACKRSS